MCEERQAVSLLDQVQWLDWQEVVYPNQQVQEWLLDPCSLTLRLQQHCHHLRVKVLQDSVMETSLPQLDRGDVAVYPCRIREVVLLGDNIPWVVARSWIPQELNEKTERLSALNDQPLGQILFAEPTTNRSHLHVAYWQLAASDQQSHSPQNDRQQDQAATCHRKDRSASGVARSSCLWFDNYPIWISELFLSEAPIYGKIATF